MFVAFADAISAVPPSFWEVHGVGMGCLILLGIIFVPRITLYFLLPSFGFFNPFHWIGYVVAPRLLALVMGMMLYWHTNPLLLCIAAIAWLVISVIKYLLCQVLLPVGAVGGGMLTAGLAMVGLEGLSDWIEKRKRR